MRVVAFMASKGGVGKTTLALHCAIEAQRLGLGPVSLIDTDPQGSALNWTRRRADRIGRFAPPAIRADAATLGRLGITLADMLDDLAAEGDATVLIDTPPRLDPVAREAARLADAVVIPCGPSILDIEALEPVVDLVRDLGRPAGIVLNQARPRGAIHAATIDQLSRYRLPICATPILRRAALMDAFADGRSIHEVRGVDLAAQIEIGRVFLWLLALLRGEAGSILPPPLGETSIEQETEISGIDPGGLRGSGQRGDPLQRP